MPQLKRTPFYDFHVKAGARMVDFAGWEMPLLYKGIIEEHIHTRTAASIFDVSHMGRLKFTGKNAEAFLQKICTRNISKGKVGQSMYSLVCNEQGKTLDDIIVSRADNHWMMVCNASNREKLLAWFNNVGLDNVTLEDETEKTAMVAIQGPKAVGLLDGVLPDPVSDLKRYHFETMRYMMIVQFTVFRSGYTGEDGAEIVCGTTAAGLAMNYLLKSDDEHSILKPAGRGARDTLRLEAGMPLYGHELTEETDPLSAGLNWAVDLSKDFIGARSPPRHRRRRSRKKTRRPHYRRRPRRAPGHGNPHRRQIRRNRDLRRHVPHAQKTDRHGLCRRRLHRRRHHPRHRLPRKHPERHHRHAPVLQTPQMSVFSSQNDAETGQKPTKTTQK